MAWVDVPGTNSLWEYENTATAANTYADAPGVYSGGIRTYTTPGTGQVNKLYARTRIPGQRNLITYSEQFDNAAWTKISITVSANTTTAPDGSATVDSWTNTAASSSYISVNPTLTVGGTYTYSIFAKAGDVNWFRISNVSSGTSGGWFNLADGTMHTQNGAGNVSSIVSVGNGWYRCSRKFAAVIAGANQVLFSPSSADNTTNAINGGVMYLWGAQVNEGVLTPYRKTEASASTTIERGELSKDFYDATHVGF